MNVFHLFAEKVDAPTSIPRAEINAAQVGNIISGALLVIGVLCVVFIIVAAIEYIISRGDAAKIKKAKESIIYAVAGLVIAGLAFAIVQFVVGLFK